MRKLFVLFLCLFAANSLFGQAPEYELKKKWELFRGINIPESILHDKKNHCLYVSNINGSPKEKNNLGYISKVSLKGKMIKEKWISNLNAPKGMGKYKGSLFVTDIDRIIEIDIKKSKIKKIYPVETAKFLNDIAIDKKGTLYISDSALKTLWILKNNKITALETTEELPSLNGLFCKNNTLYMGVKNQIKMLNLRTKEISLYAQTNTGGVDGLIKFKKNFIISDWKGSSYLVDKDKKVKLLLKTDQLNINSADLELIKSRNLLLIPTFSHNSIAAYKIIRK